MPPHLQGAAYYLSLVKGRDCISSNCEQDQNKLVLLQATFTRNSQQLKKLLIEKMFSTIHR